MSVWVEFKPAPAGTYYPLNVSVYSGTGLVTSTVGIYCGKNYLVGSQNQMACSANYLSGTQVTLVATPDSDSVAWSTNCTPLPTDPNSCTITMDQAQNVTVAFGANSQTPPHTYTLKVTSSGAGTVSSVSGVSPAFTCVVGASCSGTVTSGTTVKLTASATIPYYYYYPTYAWSGVICGAAGESQYSPTCTFTTDKNGPQTVTVSVTSHSLY